MKRVQASYTYLLEIDFPDDTTDKEIEKRLSEEAPADWWYYLEWTKEEKKGSKYA